MSFCETVKISFPSLFAKEELHVAFHELFMHNIGAAASPGVEPWIH